MGMIGCCVDQEHVPKDGMLTDQFLFKLPVGTREPREPWRLAFVGEEWLCRSGYRALAKPSVGAAASHCALDPPPSAEPARGLARLVPVGAAAPQSALPAAGLCS